MQDVVKVFSNEEPAPIPPWFHAAGGVGATKPGASGTATQELTPGRYFLVDTETPEGAEKNYAEQGAVVEFEVTEGEGGGELPAAQAKVSAREYRFTTSGLKAGQNTIEFSNEGKELHHLIAFPYNPGATLDDVKKFAAAEGPGGGPPPGPPPINFEQGESTAVLDGGQRQVTRLTLKSGKYALLCFIPDRKGGPPHVAKGMLQEVTIP